MYLNDYRNLKYKIRYFLLKNIPYSLYQDVLKYKYYKAMNKELDIRTPKLLSEKIQWLKLYDKNNKKYLLADKLKAKQYVKENIPSLFVAKVYDIVESFEKLNFDKLPSSFVIKTNHSWRTNIIVFDKDLLKENDYRFYSKYYRQALKINYAYWSYYELQYKKIKPFIYVEELLFPKDRNLQTCEYEAYCINGNVEFVRVKFNFHDNLGNLNCRYYIYDKYGKKLDFSLFYELNDIEFLINLSTLKRVVEYSEIIAKDFVFVRVDFFEVEGILAFLETTFTPFSGYMKFIPEKYDEYYGEKLRISIQ